MKQFFYGYHLIFDLYSLTANYDHLTGLRFSLPTTFSLLYKAVNLYWHSVTEAQLQIKVMAFFVNSRPNITCLY